MTDLLTADEQQLWHAWKAASERVRERVAEDIKAATGLSDPDFGILSRLVDLGDGKLRQNVLGASMNWHRSRLSHQLTRMEERDLISRSSVDGGVLIHISATGRTLVDAARPIHAAAIRSHLLDRARDIDASVFLTTLRELAA